ncbi:MAG: TonB-dependent receptor, partial [Alphaproteobacteria bacterium]|nr:TonB-dependent receptor [Alphaproteobacteria bacterium]
IFGWRHYTLSYNLDSDNSSSQGLDVNGGHQIYNQYSDEMRLAYKGKKLDGQVGLYAFGSSNDATAQFQGAGGFSFLGITNFLYGTNAYHLTGRSLAGYGQFNYHATDALTLIAGARVTNDHVGVHALADNYNEVPYTPPPFLPFLTQLPFVNIFGPLNQDYTTTGDNTNFSYKIGAQYNVTRGTMFYVTWSTGYKGPAMQTNLSYAGQSPYLSPETVKDLEGGVKAMLFNRMLRLNIAGFIENFQNFQTQSFATFGASQVSVIGNAEGVRAAGVEFNTSFKPSRAFTINYNATMEDSHFTNYSTDPCYTGQTSNGCSATQAFFNGAGINTSTAAKYTGTLEAIYEVALGSGKLEVSGNWYHRSSINFTTSGAPYAELGPIDVFGASINYRMSKGINVAIFCKNCTNEIYPNYIGSDPGDAGLGVLSTINRWGYNSVRTVGASLGFKF